MTDQSPSSGPQAAPAAVYDRITDAVVGLDETGEVTYRNERAAAVLSGSEAPLEGRPFREVVPDEVEGTFRREVDRAVQIGSPVTFEAFLPAPDAWFEVRVYPSETGVTVTLRDVTERVNRERRLEKRERALRDAYQVIAAPDASLSEQIDDLLGVVRETIGTDYGTLSRVDEATDAYVFEAVAAPAGADLEAGETTSLQATNCERVVGTERTLVLEDVEADAPELADRAGNAEWGISCYLGAPVVVDDEVYGTFCFYDMEAKSEAFTDWEVTFVDLLSRWVSSELERERRERELEESNDRLEEFAYAASHDLQEPLRMVSNHLSLLERRYGDELGEDGRESLRFAADGADRMREMIDGLLAYARVESQGEPFEPVDLDDVVADVRQDLRMKIDETDAEVILEQLPTVLGDSAQLRQLFQNLLENAFAYSGDEAPRVRVDAERSEARTTSERSGPAAETAGDEWVVSVADEGVGIDPADHDGIFEVFQRFHARTEHEGTGLGLALCERIVERHGGDIWVADGSDEGATVRFTLPAVED